MRWNQNSRIMNSSIIKEFTEYFSGGQILLKFKTNFEANLRNGWPAVAGKYNHLPEEYSTYLSRACRFVNTQAATVKIGKGSRSFDYPLSLLPPFCKKHLESSRWINLHQAHACNIIKSRRNFKNVLLVLSEQEFYCSKHFCYGNKLNRVVQNFECLAKTLKSNCIYESFRLMLLIISAFCITVIFF